MVDRYLDFFKLKKIKLTLSLPTSGLFSCYHIYIRAIKGYLSYFKYGKCDQRQVPLKRRIDGFRIGTYDQSIINWFFLFISVWCHIVIFLNV